MKYEDSLEYKYPELAKQWHPTLNGEQTPADITPGADVDAWWLLPYDDPETGKHFDFVWQAHVYARKKGSGCPFLRNREAWKGYNDLEFKYPEIAKEWHPTKNGNLKPDQVVYGATTKVWWLKHIDDPELGPIDLEWPARVRDRIRGKGDPFKKGKRVWVGYNDLAFRRPELVKEWHPVKNGNLKPTDVSYGTNKKVWWLIHIDDPETGPHDIEWQASVAHRASGEGCPYITGTKAWPGYNDLATKRREIAKEWHPTKNGDLKPSDVRPNSEIVVWWIKHIDDPEKGSFDLVWDQMIARRVEGKDPFESGHAVCVGYNDLAKVNPKLAEEWHPTKNKGLMPTDVTANSGKLVWWFKHIEDPLTGPHDFEWKARIADRNKGTGCPYISGKKVWKGYNDLARLYPELAREWHKTKNGKLTAEDVTYCSGKKVWWFLHIEDPETGPQDFEWRATVASRSNGNGCPFLNGKAVKKGYNDLETFFQEVALDWHPDKNMNLKPDEIYKYSTKKYWWKCKKCGHEWKEKVYLRTKIGCGCRKCAA